MNSFFCDFYHKIAILVGPKLISDQVQNPVFSIISDQRKIPVVLHFLAHRHKAGRAAFGLSCVARFEQLACVFASCGALHYANILAS